jgi:predicted hydrocarbon binding protein
MANVKGIVLLNAKRFTLDELGEDAWKRVLGELTGEDRDTLASAVSVGWYEMGVYDRLHGTMERVLGDKRGALMRRLGRYCAEHDLTTVHRAFFRLASPAFLLEKYADFWRRYQDSGTWTVAREGETRAHAALIGWASHEEACCTRLGAYIGRMLELIVRKEVRVSHAKCCVRGDARCEYALDWS